MLRRSATARASWKSSSEQQLPLPSRASRSETPITSYPSATQRAAATALSTPPLIATTTLMRPPLGPFRMRPGARRLRRRAPMGVGRSRGLRADLTHETGQQVDDGVDLGLGRVGAEAEAKPAARCV